MCFAFLDNFQLFFANKKNNYPIKMYLLLDGFKVCRFLENSFQIWDYTFNWWVNGSQCSQNCLKFILLFISFFKWHATDLKLKIICVWKKVTDILRLLNLIFWLFLTLFFPLFVCRIFFGALTKEICPDLGKWWLFQTLW